MDSNNLIEGLLQKPLWQMTGEEYCQLTHYALSLSPNTGSSPAPPGQKALGVHALAVELGCSDSTVYALMRTPREEDGSAEGGGILRPAVGWPTITNRPANNLRVKREIWCTMGSACEGASYRRIHPLNLVRF